MKFPGWIVLFLILSLAGVLKSEASDQKCIPKNNRSLIIGHTFDLNWWMRTRLQTSAFVLDYSIDFLDLRTLDNIQDALLKVDAVVVPGGADIHPKLYSAENLSYIASPEGEKRDEFELKTFQAYQSDERFSNLPLLGICRGMQMMAVAQGAPMIQDLKKELGIKNRNYRFDRVQISDQKSVMSELFPEGSALGFKIHHQNPKGSSLEAMSDKLKVTAYSWDKRIVEAIELLDRPALGIQFHPEQSLPSVKHSIFRWLLDGACAKTHRESL